MSWGRGLLIFAVVYSAVLLGVGVPILIRSYRDIRRELKRVARGR